MEFVSGHVGRGTFTVTHGDCEATLSKMNADDYNQKQYAALNCNDGTEKYEALEDMYQHLFFKVKNGFRRSVSRITN